MPAATNNAFYLHPINDTWAPKHITDHTKIGRYCDTNAATTPSDKNGFFDSRVMSRRHAELWQENGNLYIKDTKSQNGTFINGERLSADGLESKPFELKANDVIEFGHNVVSEDKKTILHPKVTARVVVVASAEKD